jgi:hypothetical protein
MKSKLEISNAKANTHPDEKIGKSMSCQRTKKMKLVANLNEKNKILKRSLCITLCISNGGQSANYEQITKNKQ